MTVSARISVERIDAAVAARARLGSPDALAFNDPLILGPLCDQVDWWAACIGADVLVLWPVCRPYGAAVRPPHLSYFVGPFRSAHCGTLSMHRRVPLLNAALESLATRLCAEYGVVHASVPPGFDDLRGLRWWQGARAGREARLTPRWTARIGPLSEQDLPRIHADMARNRRRDIAAVDRSPPVEAGSIESSEVLALYRATFELQGELPDPERWQSLQRTCELLRSGHGRICGWRDPADGSLAGVLLVVDGPSDTNDVLCAAAQPWRDRGLIAWATWQGVLGATGRGKRWFDFNGANSSVRAPDKHHYGAAPVLYFDVELSGR